MTVPARRFRMTVAYDGTDFAGWQIQPNGTAIQEVLEGAIRRVANVAEVKVHGSGRTDQGVHARGQVAHFDLATRMAPGALLRALNAVLPPSIRVLKLAEAPQDFHARRSAMGKEYRYFIYNGPILAPDLFRYRAHVRSPLDVSAMRGAAVHLEGRHDFAAFSANPDRPVESTVRRLDRLQVRKEGREIQIVAVGEGFLYKMVRSLAGYLIRVGEGTEAPDSVIEILESRERTARVPTAPPQGLFLWRVFYGELDGWT